MDGRRNGVSTKFFVSRLPEKCSSKDVEEALGTFGSIQGVYIAKKRDKNGYRFGFASFLGVKDATELEKQMRNVWIGSYRLFINVARFARDNDAGRVNKDLEGKSKEQKGKEQKERPFLFNNLEGCWGSSASNMGSSYADMVSGKSIGAGGTKEVTVSEYAKAYAELYNKAIIGKMKDLWYLRKLDILLKEANFGNAVIKYIGGLNVMVVFQSPFEADSFRASSAGFGWFVSVELWMGQTIAFERLAWLNIYGVPLHLSGNETFDSVGRVFGKIIHASQREAKDNILTSDCVCVLTDTVKRIEEEVVIFEKGKRFRIWIEEERGAWIPDSVDNQDVGSEDSDGWDLMSEYDNLSNKKKTDSPVREPTPECGQNVNGVRCQEEAAPVNGTDKAVDAYREYVVDQVDELPVPEVPEMQPRGGQGTVDLSGTGEGRSSTVSGEVGQSVAFNGEGVNEEGVPRYVNSYEGGENRMGAGLIFTKNVEKEQEFNKGGQRKENEYIGVGNWGSTKKIFEVDLKSFGPVKKVKKGRKPNYKKTIVEEVGEIMRPRKRLRDDDPFDLNKIIGIQEESENSVRSENNDDIFRGNVEDFEKHQQEEPRGFRKEREEEVVKDLNLKPTEEMEESIDEELHITSVMGDVLGVDLQRHEELIKEVIREEGIQNGKR
ncbi:putative RNA recognition motif domain, nucleotide-binding alpha-beta plait domain superfamily [Helianthus annuus]|nr:putative RNA recognition motif domain, nucleotide-binding alpha-beta plait domain superfamily [Helianthus annuus]